MLIITISFLYLKIIKKLFMYSIYKGFFYTKNRSGNARDMLGMEVIVLILLVLNIVVTVVTVWDVPRRVAEEEADAQALAD